MLVTLRSRELQPADSLLRSMERTGLTFHGSGRGRADLRRRTLDGCGGVRRSGRDARVGRRLSVRGEEHARTDEEQREGQRAKPSGMTCREKAPQRDEKAEDGIDGASEVQVHGGFRPGHGDRAGQFPAPPETRCSSPS